MSELFDVVVIDDADDVRAIVKRQLTLSKRFRVVAEGATGRDAVELAAKHRPHVVVLDASMPDMDGINAIGLIIAAAPGTKVVMLSGFDAASLRETALRFGAIDYVEKSTPIRELPGRLIAALGSSGGVEAEPVAEFQAEAEAVLAAHLERFRTFFDQAAIGMATLTLAGTVVRANEAMSNLLRRTNDEIVGAPLTAFAAAHDKVAIAHAVQRANEESRGQEVEHRLLLEGARDDQRWAHTTIAAVRDNNDKPLYLFAQLEDITARHDALEQLQASEERFRVMVESVQDYAIFMLNRDGLVTTWNLGAERLKGYAADEIIGQHFRVFYPAEVRERAHPENELQLALRDGRYEEEGWRVGKSGTQFWASVVITTLYDREGRHIGFAKVTRDRTDKLNADTARDSAATRLAASNAELQTAARQTEEFLAVTAHELQSPVAAINGAADILTDYWDKLDDEERSDTLGRIGASAIRIRRLLDDLLTASRLEAGTFDVAVAPIALADTVNEALREVGDIEVATHGIDGVFVYADAVRVVQILTNLLTNAAKYGKAPYAIAVSRVADHLEIRVSDAGAGPSADLQPRLFQRFSKEPAATVRGTGLGLFIVRELARRQGGDAWYEPGPTFVVSLPSAPSRKLF